MAELVEMRWIEKPLVGEDCVEREAAVSLAQDEAVSAAPIGLLRTVAQHIVIEDAQNLDRRHRGADMSAIAAHQPAHHQAPQMQRPLVKGSRRRHDPPLPDRVVKDWCQGCVVQACHLGLLNSTPRRHGRSAILSPQIRM
jgi:hypothetical protein